MVQGQRTKYIHFFFMSIFGVNSIVFEDYFVSIFSWLHWSRVQLSVFILCHHDHTTTTAQWIPDQHHKLTNCNPSQTSCRHQSVWSPCCLAPGQSWLPLSHTLILLNVVYKFAIMAQRRWGNWLDNALRLSWLVLTKSSDLASHRWPTQIQTLVEKHTSPFC